ncbi:methionyl-tRNA formyltransferase [Jannaschia ovalis]|uniref:Formyltransferase family protein n=1 Tax=Jannaschia ovalis TaxID=3038773 RepID=A0ABY8LE81_9RHOB|nr:formyltransferase family protein [Jannaschia sp. GRR-S6-38]WGH78708.1 formyltransferase family protein [Jannaschia sp. GRR-S6-38]
MKTVLVGAVDSTRAALDAMVASDHAPDLLVTLPSELSRRHSDFVDLAGPADAAGVALFRTERSDGPETLARLRALAPDLVLVIGWSQICGAEFRDIPRLGCLGFHPSALPRLRGRAVIPWTILLGEQQAGASLFWLDAGTDTGDIAAQEIFAIDPAAETARSLYDRQLAALTKMLPPLLDRIGSGDVPRQPQDHAQATICARRRPADGRIDWHRPLAEIDRLVRAVGPPYPGAFATAGTDAQAIQLLAAGPDPDGHRFIGLPGQVQAIDEDGFSVMCGDGACLKVGAWAPSDWRPKLHETFS